MTDEEALDLFKISKREKDLTDYYFHKIHDGREQIDFRKEAEAKQVCDIYHGSGLKHFNAKIFAANFEIYCHFSSKIGKIGVRLSLWSIELTESLTFRLLSLPKAKYDYVERGYQGSTVVLYYVLPAYWAIELLGQAAECTIDIKPGYIEDFCQKLMQQLIKIGIPAQSVTPVMASR